ncbi:hypothetical protein [Deinococcus roseus]|uniref:Uncharacterized protein n=1 Tax=Deinococcus roseus TaxID=392414 RepID=A0ABQ2DJ42_9DEIO|nr:hypothetical protein [Deinococcus roseus]GGJ56579.1 hypothetical protein GCM10008938_48420 [Deinococcus roseus]
MARSRNITISSENSSDVVTLTANIANVRTEIFRYKVPKGSTITIPNATELKNGIAKGVHFITELKDVSNNKIPGGSKLVFGVLGPADEFETNLRALPYSPWRQLSTDQQRNDDYKTQLVAAADLNVPGITLREGEMLVISLISTTAINWNNSYFEIMAQELN